MPKITLKSNWIFEPAIVTDNEVALVRFYITNSDDGSQVAVRLATTLVDDSGYVWEVINLNTPEFYEHNDHHKVYCSDKYLSDNLLKAIGEALNLS